MLSCCSLTTKGFVYRKKTDAKFWGAEAQLFLRSTWKMLKDVQARLPSLENPAKEKLEVARKVAEAIYCHLRGGGQAWMEPLSCVR